MTADTLRRLRRAGAAIGLAVVLGAIAAAASPLRLPDSYYYERIAARTIIPGCAEIHCFRPLVPWTLGLLPPAVAKWKAYAVLCNVGAAMAVFDLCLIVGMTTRASILAASLSAFGFGSLYTLFEPFTSDPLMFWVAPLTTRWLLQDRVVRAGALTCLGVFAKEFVVAPIVIVVLADARAGRWARARRAAAAAAIAFAVWLALQYGFMHAFGYSYGDNKSPKLSSGGYLVFWLQHESLRASMAAMFVEFGALYLLIPFGFLKAPRPLRELAVAAIPVACIFAYVQQPDRALWNFHFLTSPLSALVLEGLPNPLAIAFVLLFGLANLRIGAQVSFVPEARYALALTVVLAVVAIVADRRRRVMTVRSA
jgi:hypothetical protein